ncbi:MAG: glycosyltransferase [Candidatus Marinimicrobia bacterium]|nr:glycosyltransferase [Candidatus Neomarinimicrobiota bacterium]MCF7828782.1 glycosyltransferase [Candidatus Neomarinimicrobiota bacterium]MCF7880699.1 glycosyltransferase [Candidatus Neomarinimicrobiota bacterium]
MLYVIDALQSKGHVCQVCVPNEGPLVSELRKRKCKIQTMELGIIRRKYLNFFGLSNRIYALVWSILKLGKIIREDKIDVIYSNTLAVLCGAFAAKFFQKKHIWHIHEIIDSPKIFALFLSVLIQHLSDSAIAVSTPVKKYWDTIYKRKSEKDIIKIIHNGIPLEDFDVSRSSLREEIGCDDRCTIVGMIGRVHHWKGQDYFLKMANKIHQDFENVRFIMVGDTFSGYEYLYENLSKLIQGFGLENVVYDLGYRRDIPNLLKGFDVFVLPSTLPDPLPTVVLEAMAMQVPVVATAHGGALEMVEHGKTGYHIPWDNAKAGSVYIEKLISDKKKRVEFGNRGRRRLETFFTLDAFKKNISAVVSNVVPS